MNTEIIHNFCESRLNNNIPPEIFNSYTSLFITIIPLIYGLPENIIFFNASCMIIFNGFASFYYHYTLSWIGKQSDEISMILASYYSMSALIKLLYNLDNQKKKLYNGINNIFMILFLIINTNLNNDKFFPFIFSFYIFNILYFIHKVSDKYKHFYNNDELINYKNELMISFIGAFSWILSELYCNNYSFIGHIIWHLLFPLGFYKLIIKYDKLLMMHI